MSEVKSAYLGGALVRVDKRASLSVYTPEKMAVPSSETKNPMVTLDADAVNS